MRYDIFVHLAINNNLERIYVLTVSDSPQQTASEKMHQIITDHEYSWKMGDTKFKGCLEKWLIYQYGASFYQGFSIEVDLQTLNEIMQLKQPL